MRILTIAILAALLVILSACGGEPTPDQTFESPLAEPTTEPTTAAEPTAAPALASPQPGMGGVTGRFVDQVTGEPVPDRVIYLGELTPFEAQEGEEPSSFVMMVPTTSPSTLTDQDGYFSFLDVGPGTYAFVLWTPVDSWVLVNPETEENVMVTIQAGEVVDLGTVPIRTTR
jgi:hypothetical protein